MSIFIVPLGSPRLSSEGVRIGTVRRPPRGIHKSDFAKLDHYDVWFPNLSPGAELVKEALAAKDAAGLARFKRKFRAEMSVPDRSSELDVLAALSHHNNFSPRITHKRPIATTIAIRCDTERQKEIPFRRPVFSPWS